MIKINSNNLKNFRIKYNQIGKKKLNKYRAVRTEVDGYKFDSALEGNYYRYLKLMRQLGEVSYFLMQVPIHLCSKRKYLCDFLVFYADGTHKYIDVKGIETLTFKIKKDVIESLYPIEIHLVKKGDF